MLRAPRGKNRKKKVIEESLRPDGRTIATIPTLSGLQPSMTLTVPVKLKFIANNSTLNISITWAMVMDWICLATTATQGYDLFYNVRLHSIEAWSPDADTAVVPSNCAISFPSTTQGDERTYLCVSSGGPGYVKAKPSSKSANGLFWQASSSVPAFQLLNVNAGTLFQVSLTYRLGYVSNVACTQALSGATAGRVYLRGMDALPIASTSFVPMPINFGI
jgi:hypothetical protein